MDIQKKLTEIIPVNDREHRNDFWNEPLIDALSEIEKQEIENALIEKLYATPGDILICETLAYMNSAKGIPAMKHALSTDQNQFGKIIIALCIFKISQEEEMVKIATNAFRQLRDKWDLIFCFSYLQQFNDQQINRMIEKYINHSDYLLSYNAKLALSMN